MTEVFVVVAGLLSYVAMQGALIFVTAYLLRKSVRTKIGLSKKKAVLFSYCFWAVVLAVSVVLVGDMGSLDVWGGVLAACLTALASAAFYLWLWQRHDERSTRKML